MTGPSVLALVYLACATLAPPAAAFTKLVQKPDAAGCVADAASPSCAPGRGLTDATSVVLSPDGANAYVASNMAGTLTVYDRAADGTLTQKADTAGCFSDMATVGCADAVALAGPTDVAISSDGESVYVAASASHAVAVFGRAPDGGLIQKPGAAGCISDLAAESCAPGHDVGPLSAVVVSHDGTSVYAASDAGDSITRFERAANGTLTQQPGVAGCLSGALISGCMGARELGGPTDLALSSNDRSMYVSATASAAIVVLDRAPDGSLTQKAGQAGCIVSISFNNLCATTRLMSNPTSVALSPGDANAYFTSIGGVAVFDRAADGTLTQKPGTAGCVAHVPSNGACATAGPYVSSATSLTVSPDGANAYLTATPSARAGSPADGAVAVFERAADGALTPEPGAAGCVDAGVASNGCVAGRGLVGASSVAVSPDGANAYVSSPGSSAVAVFDKTSFAPPLPPAGPPPAPPADARPVLTRLALAPADFRPSATRSSIASGRAARGGSRVSYRLSEAATVRFGVQRVLPGRRVGGKCVRATRSNRRARSCVRHPSLQGTFSMAGKAGTNRLRFTGRLRRRALAPGRYRLRAVARDTATNRSRAKVAGFTIRAR